VGIKPYRLKPPENQTVPWLRATRALRMLKERGKLPSPVASNPQPLLGRKRVLIFLDDKQRSLPDRPNENSQLKVQRLRTNRKRVAGPTFATSPLKGPREFSLPASGLLSPQSSDTLSPNCRSNER